MSPDELQMIVKAADRLDKSAGAIRVGLRQAEGEDLASQLSKLPWGDKKDEKEVTTHPSSNIGELFSGAFFAVLILGGIIWAIGEWPKWFPREVIVVETTDGEQVIYDATITKKDGWVEIVGFITTTASEKITLSIPQGKVKTIQSFRDTFSKRGLP